MDEQTLEEYSELRDCVVAKFPIKSFTRKSEKIRSLYPDAKLLVFSPEPWKLLGAHAAAINQNLSYSLVKYEDEYLILADKRLSEFQVRAEKGKQYKTLMVLTGDML